MKKFIELKQLVLEKIENFRLKIATNPKVMLWRLRLFGVHPFFGKHLLKIVGWALFAVFVFGIFYLFGWRSPRPFPEQVLITIEKGESLTQVANSFEEKNVIRSDFWLKVFIVLLGGEKRVIAGDYYFPQAVSLFKVASMIHKGEFGLIAKKITIPEGTSSMEMAEILEKELPAFNAKDFVDEVLKNNYEGYLFPDTYFLTPNTKASEVIAMMRENFARQIKEYGEDILKSKKSLDDIVIMASIIEDEANGTLESKRIVSGILWKRLRLEMPLQVDAPFQYYNGKNSYTLTKEDLAEDHEYNTYVNKGLPPTAITNPGIDSLRAAIAPTQTSYLYFLSDKKGNMYYAKTFEEHKRNRGLYLK
ncbi:MAG: endolytic transglycosylase MltG [Candidatus Zambryskibacteria bacterium]